MWLYQVGWVLMDYGRKNCAVDCAIMPWTLRSVRSASWELPILKVQNSAAWELDLSL
jgi:hypothetical protein